jgi:hypothetical protein
MSPQFPFPRFPIWPGIGEGFPDSRFGQNRESGIPCFPIPESAGIGKQGIPVSRFGRDRESGSRWRRAGDFLVCKLGLSQDVSESDMARLGSYYGVTVLDFGQVIT